MSRAVLLVLLLLAASCRRAQPATDADCAAILDRLVDLELEARGFRDPALASRWKASARTRFADELAECRGRDLHPDALDCITHAATTEEVVHHCFRRVPMRR
jgi:hypothetical protein